jgi:FlaA1/EpsC-like NDP-sugar epimerase
MWRFSGFGEVKRLTLACALAGCWPAVVVMGWVGQGAACGAGAAPGGGADGAGLVRIAYRMVYEHARARITGGDGEVRRALVLGAGEAARMLLAGIHHQGWIVLGLLDDDPAKQGARIGACRCWGRWRRCRDNRAVRGVATHVIVAMPAATAPSGGARWSWPPAPACRC